MPKRLVSLLAAACALAIALPGCGDTLQVKPIPHNVLEGMIVSPFPVYWLGGKFAGLPVTEATHDASGSFAVQYGNCIQGGQGSCTPALRVVTSPDNSFLPTGETATRRLSIRGVGSISSDEGRTISIPTGGVVVDVYADSAELALAAARTAVAINRPGSPEEPLPARLPDTGFGSTPLPSQLPSTVRPLG